MELLFRDGVRAASRRDDGVQARAATESRRWDLVQAPLACRVTARPTARGPAVGLMGALGGSFANRFIFKVGALALGLESRRWPGSETHRAPIVASLDAGTPHSSGLALCERSRQELPPLGCLQEPASRQGPPGAEGQWRR